MGMVAIVIVSYRSLLNADRDAYAVLQVVLTIRFVLKVLRLEPGSFGAVRCGLINRRRMVLQQHTKCVLRVPLAPL